MSSPPPSTSPPGTGTAVAETVRKIDINGTQVSASALAAITAAVLGSFIGVAGTVIGAALASVITTVSSTIYQQTLERSRQRVAALAAAHTRPLLRQEAAPPEPSDPLEEAPPLPTPGPAPAGPRRPLRTMAVVAGSVAAFAVAMTVITGFEFAIGQSLSGGDKPTLASVTPDGPSEPEPAPGPAAPEESAVPSEAPESSASETGTSGSAEPGSSNPEPSDTPETDETPETTDPVLPLLPR